MERQYPLLMYIIGSHVLFVVINQCRDLFHGRVMCSLISREGGREHAQPHLCQSPRSISTPRPRGAGLWSKLFGLSSCCCWQRGEVAGKVHWSSEWTVLAGLFPQPFILIQSRLSDTFCHSLLPYIHLVPSPSFTSPDHLSSLVHSLPKLACLDLMAAFQWAENFICQRKVRMEKSCMQVCKCFKVKRKFSWTVNFVQRFLNDLDWWWKHLLLCNLADFNNRWNNWARPPYIMWLLNYCFLQWLFALLHDKQDVCGFDMKQDHVVQSHGWF